MVFHAHGLASEAADCYAKAVQQGPTSFRWRYLLARSLELSDPKQALAQAQQAVRLDPNYAAANVLLARIVERENGIESAFQHYQRAVEVDSDCAEALFGLGRSYS